MELPPNDLPCKALTPNEDFDIARSEPGPTGVSVFAVEWILKGCALYLVQRLCRPRCAEVCRGMQGWELRFGVWEARGLGGSGCFWGAVGVLFGVILRYTWGRLVDTAGGLREWIDARDDSEMRMTRR